MYSGIVYDALKYIGLRDEEFLLDGDIKPLNKSDTLFGRIFTTLGKIVSVSDRQYKTLDKIRLEIYPKIMRGDIIFLQADDDYYAHSGDITSLIYKNFGASGFITDGNVRDSQQIKDLNFPTWCKGTNPIDALGHWAITDYESSIEMPLYKNSNNLTIYTGDHVFADSDGVLIIKFEFLEEFNKSLKFLIKREDIIRKELIESDDVMKIFERFGRW